ncbi:MAG: protein-L-isoaspartate(D-aspartate) O-methyltransferase [Candidatus Odinarchaeota archaeon]
MGDCTPSDDLNRLTEMKESTLQRLIASGTVSLEETKRAYRAVPRELFLPNHLIRDAYVDTPLPIGEGQTISAIHMCLIYLELLQLEEGLKVLEIGAGSGYHAALVAEVVSPTGKPLSGHVITIERKSALVNFAQKNLKNAGYSDRVTVIEADGTLGYPDEAPYDRIMVAAAAPHTPQPLIDQLKVEGLLLIPVGRHHFWQDLLLISKDKQGNIKEKKEMSVAFVPLIGKEGWAP